MRVKRFVVATALDVAVKPVIVIFQSHTILAVVRFQGGFHRHILFLASNGCKTESSQLGHIKAGICLQATLLLKRICHQAEGVVGVVVWSNLNQSFSIFTFVAQAKDQESLYCICVSEPQGEPHQAGAVYVPSSLR